MESFLYWTGVVCWSLCGLVFLSSVAILVYDAIITAPGAHDDFDSYDRHMACHYGVHDDEWPNP